MQNLKPSERNKVIWKAAYECTKDKPVEMMDGGIAVQRVCDGNLSVTHTRIETDEALLDVFYSGHGKVASFRVFWSDDIVEVVSLKPKTVPDWFDHLVLLSVADNIDQVLAVVNRKHLRLVQ